MIYDETKFPYKTEVHDTPESSPDFAKSSNFGEYVLGSQELTTQDRGGNFLQGLAHEHGPPADTPSSSEPTSSSPLGGSAQSPPSSGLPAASVSAFGQWRPVPYLTSWMQQIPTTSCNGQPTRWGSCVYFPGQ